MLRRPVHPADALSACLCLSAENGPRYNLLNSACLELFDFIRKVAWVSTAVTQSGGCSRPWAEVMLKETFCSPVINVLHSAIAAPS